MPNRSGCARSLSRLGRDPSTISRELGRNASTRTYRLKYRASTAQWHAERRARHPKVSKLAANQQLREYVRDRLAGVITRADGAPVPGPDVPFIGRRHGPRKDRPWARSWSPEQIANRLVRDFPDDPSMRISHEALPKRSMFRAAGLFAASWWRAFSTGRALKRAPGTHPGALAKNFVSP